MLWWCRYTQGVCVSTTLEELTAAAVRLGSILSSGALGLSLKPMCANVSLWHECDTLSAVYSSVVHLHASQNYKYLTIPILKGSTLLLGCECNGHAEDCSSENLEEGVLCLDCAHNTEGNHCDMCQTGFYENTSLLFTDPNICIGIWLTLYAKFYRHFIKVKTLCVFLLVCVVKSVC